VEEKTIISSKKKNAPTVLVVGAGAVGGFYGAMLARGGARVYVVCRSDYAFVKKNGFTVESPDGNFRFIPEGVCRTVEEFGGYVDYIMVASKVLPEIDLPSTIKKAVGPDTAIFLLQNGIGIEEPIARAFSKNQVISGLAFVCLNRTGPGRIRHQAYGKVTIGLYPQGASEAVQKLGGLFSTGGAECLVETDIVAARWKKLVWNAPFNPISVLGGGLDTGEIMASEEAVRLAEETMREVLTVAKAQGHEVPEEVIVQNIEATRKMAPYKTSMLLDFMAGRPMETEAILGAAVRKARTAGLNAPRLETLYALLKLLDTKSDRNS